MIGPGDIEWDTGVTVTGAVRRPAVDAQRRCEADGLYLDARQCRPGKDALATCCADTWRCSTKGRILEPDSTGAYRCLGCWKQHTGRTTKRGDAQNTHFHLRLMCCVKKGSMWFARYMSHTRPRQVIAVVSPRCVPVRVVLAPSTHEALCSSAYGQVKDHRMDIFR